MLIFHKFRGRGWYRGCVIIGQEEVRNAMKNGQIKIITVLIVLGVTLGLLLFMQRFYTNSFVEKPVIVELQKIAFVDKVEVNKAKGFYEFNVQIKQAGNVQYEYNKVDSVIKENIKGKDYQLNLKDKTDPHLDKAMELMELSIYEAMAKNNYMWLDETIRHMAQQDNFTYKLFIDDQRLYIQLADGKHFRYEIIERGGQVDAGLDKGEL